MRAQVFNIILTIFLLSISLNCISQENYSKIKTIVIDAGHGGKDPGASGTLTKEKFITLNIALKLGYYININFPDIKVIFTRENDSFIPLKERCDIANKNKADLFISIHVNASYNNKIHGTETYTLGLHKTKENLDVAMKENSVILFEDNYTKTYDGFDPNKATSYIIFNLLQSVTIDKSLIFAEHIEDQFKNTNKRHSRGVRQAGFWVLKGATMPSILIETGFITNKDEEKYLCSENGQDDIALAIFTAFKKYKEETISVKDNETIAENKKETPAIKEIKKADKPTSTPKEEKIISKKITKVEPKIIASKVVEKKPEIIKKKEAVKKETIVKKEEAVKKEIIKKKEAIKKIIPKVEVKKKKVVINKKAIPVKKIKSEIKKETKPKEKSIKKAENKIEQYITTVGNNDLIFAVQIKTSTRSIPLGKGIYKQFDDVNVYKVSKTYKYYIGATSKIQEAIHTQNINRKLIKDCFVIALYNGQRITIKEARELLSE